LTVKYIDIYSCRRAPLVAVFLIAKKALYEARGKKWKGRGAIGSFSCRGKPHFLDSCGRALLLVDELLVLGRRLDAGALLIVVLSLEGMLSLPR
jgi:hypothetical protein